jgi:ribosomal protein S18 acetylase RimI-like enzyme
LKRQADLLLPFSLRPMQQADLPFLQTLYASTRQAELASAPWNSEQKAAFLKMQFDLQHRYYQSQFPDCRFDIIQTSGSDIGRRYVNWADDGVGLVDLSLLPEWCGRGVGTAILRQLQNEAAASGKSVSMHVEYNNPAAYLYERLGFVEIATDGVYRKLRWQLATA